MIITLIDLSKDDATTYLLFIEISVISLLNPLTEDW
jgi:hypothetical protein